MQLGIKVDTNLKFKVIKHAIIPTVLEQNKVLIVLNSAKFF